MGKKSSSRKKKKRERSNSCRRSSTESCSSSSSSSISLSSIDEETKNKLLNKIKKLKKKEKRKKKRKKEKEKEKALKKKSRKDKVRPINAPQGPLPPPDSSVPQDQGRKLAPMTKEEWEKQQNTLKRVFDEETGRMRLIKGTGEIVEECVSRERHLAINKQATRGDGEYFQKKLKQTL